jgi:hypothetical protein
MLVPRHLCARAWRSLVWCTSSTKEKGKVCRMTTHLVDVGVHGALDVGQHGPACATHVGPWIQFTPSGEPL